ncbi:MULTISPECIES: protein TolQ [Nitrosomonas]|uniref:Tol-Pal system protein TolQ n=1 Tax=Nitrosomonas europaea (strain ATCC 19718 / CIP 103999 / KCTC 2705 / NBRC 14298) TaxID=228410 RepID=Q82XP2_NITEU|nr:MULTISPECIES: protein TolQ [Nitrosomonas]KXK40294.1 MAG: MotA/TolQ/ExbB proton channel family protein [Nitrosomonas europaea]MBV6389065.1 Protein TolQ [Nitrosomonas europaea]MEB2331876.1 protein TolQ [Nitrosomonas sp.]QOJ09726.1 MAG: protein TolQ [Nitrosomonas sp. H1_AOB3]CAD84126.1 MotA/TolQ/ExbB proton channel family [Nitrosomonas europaea ATCC 19718]
MSQVITQDLSFFHLVSGASLPVQLVMLLLLLASFVSWWFIFRKLFTLRQEIKQTDEFENIFWRGSDLNALYQRAAGARHAVGSMERIFEAGFREFTKYQSGVDIGPIMDSTRGAMRAVYQREMDRLESHLSFLATVGSVSPYVGLFGTVWGIMNAFRELSNVGQATIAHVAPGIAEALIATAMGLFAAIPAVIAYNRYASDTAQLATRYESFIEEVSNVLQRRVAKPRDMANFS